MTTPTPDTPQSPSASRLPAPSGPAPRRLRIGVAGLHIECSTFTPHTTRYEDFTVLRGDELLALFAFTAPGTAPWAENVEWVPLVHARAVPGGPVAPAAYERLRDELLERLTAAGPLDGLLLDLHGAMHVHGEQDIEAALAAQVARTVPQACLISCPTDLHGSITEALVTQVDLITAHRLAPHEDEWETRERAARLLVRCLNSGQRPAKAWVRIPVLLPGEKTSTQVEPARGLYASLAEVEAAPGILDAALWVGYAWADEPRSAAAAVVLGTDEQAALTQASRLAERYWAARDRFAFVGPTGTAREAVAAAAASARRPFVISDSGDNPTAGGAGDVTDLLGELLSDADLASRGLSTVYASITDPEAVAQCSLAGVGSTLRLSIGGRLDPLHGRPLPLTGRVEFLSGEDTPGGATAVLTTGGVRIVLTSRRQPFHHVEDFTRLGIDPSAADVVVVKIGYLEPELRELAGDWIIALTPGGVDQDLPRLGHRQLTRPLHPFDVGMATPDLTPRLVPARTAGAAQARR
ncbi:MULTISPECIES: M81 family metallopeptidase [unclassified Streptomyces]|uniref:M81 family metallopeptidase n=1 Tax=unclassified Streptomyces TaxID=2593676 RepID=UPI001F0432DD|nr:MULTISPECIES: M81 family metallopeptidase [unclassified Streptomyces]MCH0564841.1 M81 family metallopeptidase [Streptomyces sp. MUM 2J]MCH0569885.1 M81 family metallopeptidase [Streptomyces sp. MUM 136J]